MVHRGNETVKCFFLVPLTFEVLYGAYTTLQEGAPQL